MAKERRIHGRRLAPLRLPSVPAAVLVLLIASCTETVVTTAEAGDLSRPVIPVPELAGVSKLRAVSLLGDLTLEADIRRRYAKGPAGVVMRQRTRPGRRVAIGTTIVLVVSRPIPFVPDVLYEESAKAKAALRRAGYDIRVVQGPSLAPLFGPGTVVNVRPFGRAVPGTVITLAVSPAAPPRPACDPSYPDVCIAPYPPDLNCDDVPYTNIRVVGSDPHGFDGNDNDGSGCE